MSLSEHDAQLELLLEGRPEKYMGRLNLYDHLSNFERWTGRHGKYDSQWAYKLISEYEKSDEYRVPELDVPPPVKGEGESSVG